MPAFKTRSIAARPWSAVVLLLGVMVPAPLAVAGSRDGASSAQPFRPDPASVERFGAGYRYPQAGWVVLHIEGEPYERGVQHG